MEANSSVCCFVNRLDVDFVHKHRGVFLQPKPHHAGRFIAAEIINPRSRFRLIALARA